MRVLQLCTKVPFPAKDGGSLAIIAFTHLLGDLNYSVTILAANTPKHKINIIPDLPGGVNLISVPVNTSISIPKLIGNLIFSALPYNVARFWNNKYKKQLIELLNNNSFDIIQLEGPHMGVFMKVLRKYSKSKIVLRTHNVEFQLWNDLALESMLFKKLYLNVLVNRLKKFELRLISDVDGLIAISNHDLQEFLNFNLLFNSVVIPFVIDLSKYVPSSSFLSGSLFYIGALDWIPNQKGLVWFLDNVWPQVRSKPGISFHVAGRNAPDWLKKRLLKENIYFYGEIEDALKFMNRFRLMVIPLFSGSGVRIKILEGMALKKPIITTSKGALGLDVVSGKELIIVDNHREFINSILSVIDDDLKLNELGEAARAFISQEFDNLALANKVEDFYLRIKSV